MRRVTGHTAFVRFHRRVFEDEGPHGVGVTLGADGKLAGGGADLVPGLRSVGIVAVTALHQPDIDAVTIGPGELGLLRSVATETKVGLRFHQHEIYVFGFVRAVARGATDSVGEMSGFGEVLGLETGLVALGTDGGCLRRGESLEADDLGDVSAALDMRLRRTVTGLASVLFALEQGRVRSVGEMLVPDFFVASFADVGLGILAAGGTGQGGCLLRSGAARSILCMQR